jgi:hypothetical protein
MIITDKVVEFMYIYELTVFFDCKILTKNTVHKVKNTKSIIRSSKSW